MSHLSGRDASFTWATGPTVDTANGIVTRASLGSNVHDITPFGYSGERYLLTSRRGRVSMRCVILNSITTAPAIPNGTLGTLTVTFITGATWTFTAQMVNVSASFQSIDGNPAQVVDYDFIVSASSSSDPVTVA
jgi:hypothetical protein